MPVALGHGRGERGWRWIAAPVAVLAVATWLPPSRAPRERAVSVPVGSYVLARAASARPPIPFQFRMAGGTVAGTVDSARITLAADSSYTDKVTVRWLKAPALPLPIPGLTPGPEPRVLTGAGHYTVHGDQVTLRPGDWITRGFISTVEAKAGAGSLTLTGMSGGLAGSRVVLDAVFTRAR